MRRTGAGGGDADAQLAGELGVRRSHEGGHLLVPRLHKLDLAFGALQRAKDPVDAVAGIAIDAPHTPLVKSLDKEIADGLGHGVVSCTAGVGSREREEASGPAARSTLRRWSRFRGRGAAGHEAHHLHALIDTVIGEPRSSLPHGLPPLSSAITTTSAFPCVPCFAGANKSPR